MRLRVQYDRAQDLLADDEAQFQRGGVLVRVEPPPGLALFETVELEIATSFASRARAGATSPSWFSLSRAAPDLKMPN